MKHFSCATFLALHSWVVILIHLTVASDPQAWDPIFSVCYTEFDAVNTLCAFRTFYYSVTSISWLSLLVEDISFLIWDLKNVEDSMFYTKYCLCRILIDPKISPMGSPSWPMLTSAFIFQTLTDQFPKQGPGDSWQLIDCVSDGCRIQLYLQRSAGCLPIFQVNSSLLKSEGHFDVPAGRQSNSIRRPLYSSWETIFLAFH